MDTIETIRNRRSVRKFTDENISKTDLLTLKEALLRSPSSRGRNHWSFYFVQDKESLKKLSESKADGSTFIKDAKLAVVVCGDENICDVWIEDCSIASTILQLTAHSLGLGSCWIQIRNRNHSDKTSSEEFVKNLLNIKENVRVLSIIAIGYPAQKTIPLDYSKLEFDKIKDIC
ncbi:MAG: nitroreductase family protein [Chitinispirillales bacterium]|jgi:nitroreductase|nr:nitroreductase family protein [Chitinispirillales bacterium]